MALLPELTGEDMAEIQAALQGFLLQSEATAALLTAEGGFLILEMGNTTFFDPASLGALAANAFFAAQAMARVIDEEGVRCVVQQGIKSSLLISNVDEATMLVVLFPASGSVGAIKHYCAAPVERIAHQMELARQRAPGKTIDLAMLDLKDSTELFRRKDS